MNIKPISRRRKEAMTNKEYRDSLVEEHVRTGIPFQIRALREKEKWTQKELGDKAEMKQERISVLEDPDYSKFNISTLLKLASAFDVGLTVRFVPFSKVILAEDNLSETLVPDSYREEKDLHRLEEEPIDMANKDIAVYEDSTKEPLTVHPQFIAGIPGSQPYRGVDFSYPSVSSPDEAWLSLGLRSINTINADVKVYC